MLTKIITTLSFSLLAAVLNGQQNLPLYLGSCHSEIAKDAVEDSNKNKYVLSWSSVILENSDPKFSRLCKLNSQNIPVWTKAYHFEEYWYYVDGRSLALQGNSVFVTGRIYQGSAGPHGIFLSCLDTAGNTIWTYNYGEGIGIKILATADAVYVTGKTSTISGQGEAFLLKTSLYGDVVWKKTFVKGSVSAAFDIKQDQAGSILLTGLVAPIEASQFRPAMIKISPEGIVLWQKYYNLKDNEEEFYTTYQRLTMTEANGNYYLGGTFEDTTETRNFLAIVDSASGEIIQINTHDHSPGDDYNNLENILAIDDGIITTGLWRKKQFDQPDIRISKFSYSGNAVWSKAYGGPERDEIIRVLPAQDGLCVVGTVNNITTGNGNDQNFDVQLFFLDHNGNSTKYKEETFCEVSSVNAFLSYSDIESNDVACTRNAVFVSDSTIVVAYDTTGCGTKEPEELKTFSDDMYLFPNPASDHIKILKNTDEKIVSVKVYDASGRIIPLPIENSDLTVSFLAQGIYMLDVKTDLREKSFKICVQR